VLDGPNAEARPAPGRPLALGRPTPLFDASAFSERLGPVYDVAADGRFLFLRPGGAAGAARRDDFAARAALGGDASVDGAVRRAACDMPAHRFAKAGVPCSVTS
jgi:hypothetical protein